MNARVVSAAALALATSPAAAQGTGFYGLTGVRDIHGDVSVVCSLSGGCLVAHSLRCDSRDLVIATDSVASDSGIVALFRSL